MATDPKISVRPTWLPVLLVFAAALVMGMPTLRGGFVGGDDRQLVLNHVLVNHPSFEHALKLFTIYHRDLYQPIPLLSFSAEFAVAGAMGLLSDGIDGASWLFHLTNVLLHGLNAVLVWMVVYAWQAFRRSEGPRSAGSPPALQSGLIATSAALIFALHPLQVEVVAWLNGRMMLLSTMFALLAIWTFGRWFRDRRISWLIWSGLCIALCGMSKVRVGLVPVLVMLPLAFSFRGLHRIREGDDAGSPSESLDQRVLYGTIGYWLLAFVIMGFLAVINIEATAEAGMFEGAAEKFKGPRLARVILSLGWYFRHFLIPTGLAAWYPSPWTISWSAPQVVRATLVCVVVVAMMVVAARRSRVALMCFGWFFATLAATLPIVPARSTLAADRYMYLPIIGLAWAMGCGVAALRGRWLARPSTWWSSVMVAGIGLCGAMLGISWHVAATYNTYLSKTKRLADLFPDTPHVWERVGWSYFSLGDYERAIEFARRELVHAEPMLISDAYGLIGLAELRLGRIEDGLTSLRLGLSAMPDRALSKHRLAGGLDDAGKTAEAIALWEEVVKRAPRFNPALVRLAAAYRKVNRGVSARTCYERVLENNPYDVQATLGLAELDIKAGTGESMQLAERRLRALLSWMPENTVARANLGVVLVMTGRTESGMRAYIEALSRNPRNLVAAVNLSRLLISQGQSSDAVSRLNGAVEGIVTIDELLVVNDLLLDAGATQAAVSLWDVFESRGVAEITPDASLCRALTLAVHGDESAAFGILSNSELRETPAWHAANVMVLLDVDRHFEAVDQARLLVGEGDGDVEARRRLLQGLQLLDGRRPGSPWPYCVAAILLSADGRVEAARMSLSLCRERCDGAGCGRVVAELADGL